MFPFRDHNRSSRFPYLTVSLIAINTLVFLYEVLVEASGDIDQLFDLAALIPGQLTANPVGEGPTVITSMFMHGGWLHLIGNMWYLWLFGDNIEDTFGAIPFLIFYLVSGVVADVAHIVTNLNSFVPTIGASGAIAGVLGAYLIRFPRAQVDTIIFLGYFGRVIRLPAIVVLGLWFVLQLFQGVLMAGVGGEGAGIAYSAHVGGFLAGLGMMALYNVVKPRVDIYR